MVLRGGLQGWKACSGLVGSVQFGGLASKLLPPKTTTFPLGLRGEVLGAELQFPPPQLSSNNLGLTHGTCAREKTGMVSGRGETR